MMRFHSDNLHKDKIQRQTEDLIYNSLLQSDLGKEIDYQSHRSPKHMFWGSRGREEALDALRKKADFHVKRSQPFQPRLHLDYGIHFKTNDKMRACPPVKQAG